MTHPRVGQSQYVAQLGGFPASLVVAGCALVFAAYVIAPASTWPERGDAEGGGAFPGSGASERQAGNEAFPAPHGILDAAGADRIRRIEEGRKARPQPAAAGRAGPAPAPVAAVPDLARARARPQAAAVPEAEAPARPVRDPRVMTRPRPDAPPQTGWIPVDEAPAPAAGGARGEPAAPGARTPAETAEGAPPVAEPLPDKPPILTFNGIAFVEQSGNPTVSVNEGSLTFADSGSGLVFAPVVQPDQKQGTAHYSVGFEARTESGSWQLAVDANPRAKTPGERAGTVVEYRVGGAPGLYVTRAGRKLVSSGAFEVDLDWHAIKALLAPTSLALYVDRKQVLILNRSKPTFWMGLGGIGEFRNVELRPR